MDPLTAALNLATAVVALATKVWDATPPELQRQEAGNYAKFFLNIGDFILAAQAKINSTVK